MSKPSVCAVMLVNGREAMTRRAIASFQAQTYEAKRLLIWDTAPGCGSLYSAIDDQQISVPDVDRERLRDATVGCLRNWANKYALAHYTTSGTEAEVIAHWDSDDWSHPRRLEEQVALLESTGKMCVGYRDLLFWDTRELHERPNQAWIYRNDDPRWAAGASFLYRRELWERQPFDDAPHEDQRWWLTPLVSSQCVGMSAIVDIMPRMICQIHGANTEAYDREKMLSGAQVWRRAPEYDQLCAERMKL